MKQVGLRVDVDTLRGTRVGVPELVRIFAAHDISASFFFSVGPDNMGRHLWRLLRPAFFVKMLRTKAASLYGWDILLKGTLWPGPLIGKHCAGEIRSAAIAGHEIGLHAWDHHRWQRRLAEMPAEEIQKTIQRGFGELTRICGRAPVCFAAPAWQLTPEAETVLEAFPFDYVSTTRGEGIFRPVCGDRLLGKIEVATNLPTYDESVGHVCEPEAFNDMLLQQIGENRFNVLTIHAEVEGIVCSDMFREFLAKAKAQDIQFVTLGSLIPGDSPVPSGRRVRGTIPGREGWITLKGT